MSYICYKKGVTSVTGVTNSSQISFRRPKGGRISCTFTFTPIIVFPRFFAFGSTTRLRFALNDSKK